MSIMKRLLKILFVSGSILFLNHSVFAQTSFSDGPMRLEVYTSYVFVIEYYDALADAENRWAIWARDDGNYDGSDWRREYGCIQENCYCHWWVNGCSNGSDNWYGTARPIMRHSYTGTTVPGRFDLKMETVEDDGTDVCSGCGDNCYTDRGCSVCPDKDDDYCSSNSSTHGHSPSYAYELGSNIYYRNMGPPCTLNGSVWSGGCGLFTGNERFICPVCQTANCGNWGMQFNTKWWYNGPNGSTSTCIWRGQYSNDWQTACNWSNNKVPTSTNPVIIPTGYAYKPIIYNSGGIKYCKNIEIQTGTEIEIQATSTSQALTITD